MYSLTQLRLRRNILTERTLFYERMTIPYWGQKWLGGFINNDNEKQTLITFCRQTYCSAWKRYFTDTDSAQSFYLQQWWSHRMFNLQSMFMAVDILQFYGYGAMTDQDIKFVSKIKVFRFSNKNLGVTKSGFFTTSQAKPSLFMVKIFQAKPKPQQKKPNHFLGRKAFSRTNFIKDSETVDLLSFEQRARSYRPSKSGVIVTFTAKKCCDSLNLPI